MVNSDGQLFTIEGIAAALILLVTAYLVLNATSIYTTGDTHINDMQLEVIGTDALKMMNTPENGTTKSPLVTVVENNDPASFFTLFNNALNNRTGTQSDTIQFMANVTYVMSSGPGGGLINTSPLGNSSRGMYGGEHAVHISQWIIVDNWNAAQNRMVFPECPGPGSTYCSGKHAALVEVLLWRD